MLEEHEGLEDHRPVIICPNNHTICFTCANVKLSDSGGDCIIKKCKSKVLETFPLDHSRLKDLRRYAEKPEMPSAELVLSPRPFATRSYCDIYTADMKERQVAVRVLGRLIDLDKHRGRLETEAKLAFGLNHPNILRLYGMTPSTELNISVVMEYADGGSLANECWLSKHKTDPDLVIRVSIGIVDGLQYLHSRNVAHRELKPSNILLVRPDMVPKISDFGLKKVIQMLVKRADMLGEPKYMAPEVFEEEMVRGFTADVYSLSVILYELFSGVAAETELGETIIEIIKAVLNGTRPKITTDMPKTLAKLIEKGWSGRPDERPDLEKFRDELLDMMTFLRLGNEDLTSCYANSLLQLFMAMDSNIFSGTDEFSSIIRRFISQESRDPKDRESSMKLREFVGGEYSSPSQQDVQEFYRDLLAIGNFPSEVSERWTFHQSNIISCLKCKTQTTCVDDKLNLFMASRLDDCLKMNFEDLFKSKCLTSCLKNCGSS